MTYSFQRGLDSGFVTCSSMLSSMSSHSNLRAGNPLTSQKRPLGCLSLRLTIPKTCLVLTLRSSKIYADYLFPTFTQNKKVGITDLNTEE